MQVKGGEETRKRRAVKWDKGTAELKFTQVVLQNGLQTDRQTDRQTEREREKETD